MRLLDLRDLFPSFHTSILQFSTSNHPPPPVLSIKPAVAMAICTLHRMSGETGEEELGQTTAELRSLHTNKGTRSFGTCCDVIRNTGEREHELLQRRFSPRDN